MITAIDARKENGRRYQCFSCHHLFTVIGVIGGILVCYKCSSLLACEISKILHPNIPIAEN